MGLASPRKYGRLREIIMKLSKKVLAALSTAALLATAGVFVSCSDEDDSGEAFNGGKVDYNNARVYIKTAEAGNAEKTSQITGDVTEILHAVEGETKEGYVNMVNNSYLYRAFKQTKTKHRGGVCEIKITPNKDSPATKEGAAGFVFDLVKDVDAEGKETGTYSFCVATVDWDVANNNLLRTYISQYKNVYLKDNNFTTLNNFAIDADGKTAAGAANEIQILPTSGVWYSFETTDFVKASDGTVTVVIKVGAKESQTDGSYTVGYYKTAEEATADGENTFTNAVKEVAVPTSKTNREDAKTQNKLAYYVQVTAGEHYTVNFDFSKTFGAAVVFEDDGVIAE